MAFEDVTFPVSIAYQSRSGPAFRTFIVTADSGLETRISRWSSPRRRFDVRSGIKTRAQLALVRDFFLARKGALVSFRFTDPLDFTSNPDGYSDPDFEDQEIGVGDGSQTVFRLKKVVTSGTTVFQQLVTKAQSGTISVGLNGSEQLSGYTANATNGTVTFSSAPGIGVLVTAGFKYDVPARFGENVDTEGLLATAVDFDITDLGEVEILEEPNPQQVEDMVGGQRGAKAWGALAADVTIDRVDGFVQTFAPTSPINVNLPTLTLLPFGGPIFWLYNLGSANIAVREIESVNALGEPTSFGAIATVAPGASIELSVAIDTAGEKLWVQRVA